MRVSIVKISEPLPIDGTSFRTMRAGMVANALVAAGHEVTWWSSSLDHLHKRQRVAADSTSRLSNLYSIRLLHCLPYRRNIGLARLLNHAQLGLKLYRAISREPKPDICFVAMPTIEMAFAISLYSRKHNVPMVVDIRDLWPDAFLSSVPRFIRWAGSMALIPYQILLRRALRQAVALVAVSPEYLRWGLDKIRRRASRYDRTFPLGYMPNHFRATGEERPMHCWFLGTFGHMYDLETILGAAALLRHRSDIRFVLSGTGDKLKTIESIIQRERLTNVHLTGWLSQEQIQQSMQTSHVGLACYSRFATQSIPNKIVEFLSAGLPVISSLKGECEHLLSKFGCGLNYEPGDAEGLQRAVLDICDHPEKWRQRHRNALDLYTRYFDASKIYPDLVRMLEEIAENSRGAQSPKTARAEENDHLAPEFELINRLS